jgi:hypothetical protein
VDLADSRVGGDRWIICPNTLEDSGVTMLKNRLRKLILATLVQNGMRLAPRSYVAGWSHVFRDTKWTIE